MTHVNMPKVNKRFFTQLLRDRNLSQRELAKRMDLDQSSIVRALQGKRKFTNSETASLARILEIPMEDVLRNLDVDVPVMRAHQKGLITVAIYIETSRVVMGRPPKGPRAVVVPPNESGIGMRALRCEDPGPLDGAYLYYRPATEVSPDAIGRLAICTLQGGEAVAGTLRHGSKRATYTVVDFGGRVIVEDAWLESAVPVVWIKAA